VICTFLIQQITSQVISGAVYDSKSSEPIIGADVYLDGSSMGTITDLEGKFRLNSKYKTNIPLVIRYLGYQTKKIPYPFPDTLSISLEESVESLNEVVVIGNNIFTREQKLKVFKEELLGDIGAAKRCKILNEDDIRMYFNTAYNTLEAFSSRPIIILNDYLKYEIEFELTEFKIYFKSRSLDRLGNIKYTSIIGTTFFKDLGANTGVLEKRKRSYLGSALHFMRTCISRSWEEEGYKIKNSYGKKVAPESVLNLNSSEYPMRLKLFDKITVIHKGRKTIMNTTDGDVISLDYLGNYSLGGNLALAGYMSYLRMGNLLPLDFFPEAG